MQHVQTDSTISYKISKTVNIFNFLSRFDKMKFPLFIYIKPPDDSILQRIVPTVWWESQHVAAKEADEEKKKAYYASCASLQQHVQELEFIQVFVLVTSSCKGYV